MYLKTFIKHPTLGGPGSYLVYVFFFLVSFPYRATKTLPGLEVVRVPRGKNGLCKAWLHPFLDEFVFLLNFLVLSFIFFFEISKISWEDYLC